MVFSRCAPTDGAPMRLVSSPLSQARLAFKSSTFGNRLGIELALPLTILAFLFFAQHSTMLQMEVDNIVEWFVKNEPAFWAVCTLILFLPLRMIAIMILERRRSVHEVKSTPEQSLGHSVGAV